MKNKNSKPEGKNTKNETNKPISKTNFVNPKIKAINDLDTIVFKGTDHIKSSNEKE